MWFLTELEQKTGYTETSIFYHFIDKEIPIKSGSCRGEWLGHSVSDKDGDDFIRMVNEQD